MRWLQVEELEQQAALAGDLPRRAQQQQLATGSLAQPEKLFYIDAQVHALLQTRCRNRLHSCAAILHWCAVTHTYDVEVMSVTMDRAIETTSCMEHCTAWTWLPTCGMTR